MNGSGNEEQDQYLSTEEDDVDVDGDGKQTDDKKARAHHNLLERKRRDHIKESFEQLKNCLPSLGSDRASRASILNSATGYINQLKKSNAARASENDRIQRENELLEQKLRDAGVPVSGTTSQQIQMRRPVVNGGHMHAGNTLSTAHYSVPLEHQLGSGPVGHVSHSSTTILPGVHTLAAAAAASAAAASTSTSTSSSLLMTTRMMAAGSFVRADDSSDDDSSPTSEPAAKRLRPTRRRPST